MIISTLYDQYKVDIWKSKKIYFSSAIQYYCFSNKYSLDLTKKKEKMKREFLCAFYHKFR